MTKPPFTGRITNFIVRLKANQSGVAMLELAGALPFFVTLSIGGLEIANMSLSNMRISQMAMMVADNAGRVRISIDETDVNEVMVGARFSGTEMNFGPKGRVILSSVEANNQASPNTGYTIKWQRCFGQKNSVSTYGVEGAGATNSSMATGIGPTGRKIIPVPGSALMFVEVFYEYQPLINNLFYAPQVMNFTAAFNVRERSSNSITNVANLPASQKRLCSTFSAT
jgi:hypothetical protein